MCGMRVLLLVVVAFAVPLACGAEESPADAGPAYCSSTPTDLGVCPTGVRTCIYWAERTTCGTTYCPCAAAPVSTNTCGGTGGCTVPTDNAKDCAPGGACNANTGCVLRWCGRSCLCGADGKWTCNRSDCP